ncbi:MAG: TIGR03905 family TSCPD domain-containing protein [Bacilli bacterium]|nr:TIGR03905 family TSCPD domain-containing protein [Bacilli bacterium]
MRKEYSYTPTGVCSRRINIVLEDNIIESVEFIGGCNGNTQGVAKLAAGRDVDEVIEILAGTRCGGRPTSCPDQLARALLNAKNA